ncbi:hypothetical protein BJX96DRAFT_56993 [Aspergillus floccosus]
MGRRSNAPRKRKRDTTSQALDLLNDVSSTNNQTRHSLPRISRELRASLPRHPRSDNIRDDTSLPQFVPSSQPLTPRRSTRLQQSSPADPPATKTSSQHVPRSQPFTPRRSTRLRQSSPANPTPTRRSLRHSDAGQANEGNATLHPLDTSDQADPDKDKGPDTSNMNIDEGDEGENENVGFKELDEDNAHSRSLASPGYSPPSVLVYQDLSRESVAQESSPSDDDSAGADGFEAQYHTPPPERRQGTPGPRASLNSQMVRMESVVGSSANTNATSDSDSRHTSPERDTSPVIPNERRRPVDRDDEPYYPDGSSQSDSAAQSQNESEDADMDDFWFREAKKLGGHEETWRNLIENKREMEDAASSAKNETFEDIENLISRLGSLYKDGIEHLRVSRRVPRGLDAQWRNALDMINESGDLLITQVHNRVERRKPTREDGEMLTDFEGRVIARMIHHVLLPSFQIYYQSQGRYGRFPKVLEVLKHFVMRVYSLTAGRGISCKNRSKGMLRPLKLLIASLNKRELMPVSYSGPMVQHQHSMTEDSRRPWTDDEGKVLIAALRRYTDDT